MNWIGGHRCRSGVKIPGAFLCYTSASIGKKVFAKIVLVDRHTVRKWRSGGLPHKRFLR